MLRIRLGLLKQGSACERAIKRVPFISKPGLISLVGRACCQRGAAIEFK